MNDLLKFVSEYELDVETRAFAHFSSANYHRRRGLLWGIAASGLSGAAGCSALAGAAMKLEPVKAAFQQLGPSIVPFFVFIALVLFALAVLSAIEASLAHPKQASTHMSSYAGYSHVKRRLELIRLRYTSQSFDNADLPELFNALEEISQQIKDVAAASIYPVSTAYASGKRIKQDNLSFNKEWEETFDLRPSPPKNS